LTRALASRWTQELSDDRLDSITQIWLRFPLPVCAACVHHDGIAAEKVRNPRSGRLEVRRFVPSDPELREWCNEYIGDLTETAHIGEIAARPIVSPPLAPELQPRTPEAIAHVQRIVAEMKTRCGIDGKPTEQERRIRAERVLETAARKRA
jgi:hypothetical protein